ncbi:MAG: twin transmembrane helix small protein [Pedobacter sp.]|nr:twin transmembrane helix small protein [Pedobacter sp.]
MWIKIIVLLAMLAVLFSLFTALYHLMKGGPGESQKTLKFLIWRLGFSIAIILGLFIASWFGLIAPHGLPQVQVPAATATAPR